MAKITGGHLAIRVLKREGVEVIFALCGLHLEPYFQACIDEGIRLIDVRHEQTAAVAAEGWARVTGKPGVAMGTAGPGVVNMITGIWNAYQCKAPILVFGGKSALSEFDLGSAQDCDSLALVDSITKWKGSPLEPGRVAEYISIAYRQATTGRPGPVYIEVPQDVLIAEIEETEVTMPVNYRTAARPEGDTSMIKQAADMLINAKKPLVIAGSGIWWSRAEKELRELIETLKLPLVLCQAARGAVPEDHPLCFGPTRVGTREADVILLIGTRLNYNLNFGRPGLFSKDAKWIQIDIEAEEIGSNRPIDIGIVGDAKAVLGQFISEIKSKCHNRQELPWIERCHEYFNGRQLQLEIDMNSNSIPIHPARLCKEIREFIDKDAYIVMDGGDTTVWGASILKAYEPGHWMDNGPTGCLGLGIPYAMAAKIAAPDKQVLLLNGDGSFGLNAMEFDTMVRHKIPVVCVICNDGAWGMITHIQETLGEDRIIGSKLGFVRYDKMVESLGCYAELVEKPQDIKPALERAFDSGKPAVINVKCASISRSAHRRPTYSQ